MIREYVIVCKFTNIQQKHIESIGSRTVVVKKNARHKKK